MEKERNELLKEEMVAYSQSYAKMEETERAISYAVDRASKESYSEGFSEGESVGVSKGIRDTALNLKNMGLDYLSISRATGLTIEDIESL